MSPDSEFLVKLEQVTEIVAACEESLRKWRWRKYRTITVILGLMLLATVAAFYGQVILAVINYACAVATYRQLIPVIYEAEAHVRLMLADARVVKLEGEAILRDDCST